MSIIIEPQLLQVAQGIEGVVSINGGRILDGIPLGFNKDNFNYNATHYSLDNTSRIVRKLTGVFNQPVSGKVAIPKNQGWQIEALSDFSANDESSYIGVQDSIGRLTGFYLSYILGFREVFLYYQGSIINTFTYGAGDKFQIVSDTDTIKLYHNLSLKYQNVTYLDTYRFLYQIDYANTALLNCLAGSTSGFVQWTWDDVTVALQPPEEAVLRRINNYDMGITVNDTRSRLFEAARSGEVSGFATIQVSPLYLKPIPNNRVYAIFGEEVEFETNGGTSGTFTASEGVIIDTLKWLCPNERVTVDFRYEIGSLFATAQLEAVPKLEIKNIKDGYLEYKVAQGETIQLESNIPETVFYLPEGETLAVTSDGQFTAPTNAQNEVFGADEVEVHAEAFGQIVVFKVIVYPMYPTPEFCGLNAISWVQKALDKLPISKITRGGKREAKNQNKNGVIYWNIEYSNAPMNCCGCGDDDCTNQLANTKRLDEFWELYDTTTRFSFIDKHTKKLHKDLQIVDYDGGHRIYDIDQNRKVQIYYDGGITNLDLVEEVSTTEPAENIVINFIPPVEEEDEEPIDEDVQAYFTATGLSDETLKTAWSNFVASAKLNGYWDNFDVLMPMLGGTASSHGVNAKSPGTFDGTWFGGWTHSATGALPNGTNAYMTFGYIPSVEGDINSVHTSFYSRTDSAVAGYDVGVTTAGSTLALLLRWTDNNFYVNCYTSNWPSAANADSLNFHILNRVSGASLQAEKKGVQVINSATAPMTLPTIEVALGCHLNGGSPVSYSNRECAFFSLGSGMTTQQLLDFYNDVETFQSEAYSRGV